MAFESLNKFKRTTGSGSVTNSGSYSSLDSFKKGVEQKVQGPSDLQKKQAEFIALDEAKKKADQKKKDEQAVFDRKEVISAPTGNEKTKLGQKLRTYLDSILNPSYSKESAAATIKLQQEGREQVRKEDLNQIIGKESIFKTFWEGLQSGSLSTAASFESAGSVGAGKVGAFKLEDNLKKKAQNDLELGQEFSKTFQPELFDTQFSTREKLKNPRYIAGLIGQQLPNLMVSIIGGLATGGVGSAAGLTGTAATVVGASGATVAGSTMTFGDAYNSAKQFGLNDKQAEQVAFGTAITSAPLEFIPEFRLFSKFASKEATELVKKSFTQNVTDQIIKYGGGFVKQGGLETATEIPQTVVENAWKKTYDENQDLMEGVPEAALTAFITGGLSDSIFTAANALYKQVKPLAIEQDPSFFKKTGDKTLDSYKNEIKDNIKQSVEENGAKVTIDLIAQKNGIDKDIATRIVEEAVENTKLQDEIVKAQEEIAKEQELEKIVFSDTKPQLPEEALSVIPTNKQEEAGVAWQDTMEAEYADKLQQMDELSKLLEQSTDENTQKEITGEIETLKSEVDSMVSLFAKQYEAPSTTEQITDREQKLMGTMEQMAESGYVEKQWNDTFLPVLEDKLNAIDEQSGAEKTVLEDTVNTLESLDKKTQAQRQQLKDAREDLAELNSDIKSQKDSVTKEIEDQFVAKMRQASAQELYFLQSEGSLPNVIPLTSFENGIARAIMPFILNGESVADIKKKQLAQFTDDISFEANGLIDGIPVGEDNLLVTRFDGQPIEKVVPLKMAYDIAKNYVGDAKVKPKVADSVFSMERAKALEKQMRDVYASAKGPETTQGTIDQAVENSVKDYRESFEFEGIYYSDEEFNSLPQLETIKENARQEFLAQQNNNTSFVDEKLGKIRDDMELSEPGKRISNGDGVWTGYSSTFPKWIPEGPLRSNKLFAKIMSYVSSPDTMSYPVKPTASRQRLLVNYIFDRLDATTGVDTSSVRDQIMREYEKQRTKQTNRGDSDSVSEGTFAERFDGTSNFGETNTTTEYVTSQDVRYDGAWINTQTIESQPISNTQALTVFRDFIPETGVTVQFMKNITTPDGGRAFGATFRDVVQFVENPKETTVYHETVHAFLNLFVTPEQREAYNRQAYKDAVKEIGIAKVDRGVREIMSRYQYKISENKARMIYGEERLADGFISFVKDNKASSRLKRFYSAILSFVQRIIDSKASDRLYKDIMDQKRDAHNALLTRQDKHFEAIQKRYSETTKLIKIFETEFTGPTIKRVSIDQSLKREGIKQADIDLITRTVNQLDPGETLNRADFLEALRQNMFKVTMHVTTGPGSYADYGLRNLKPFNGSDAKSVNEEVVAETHIYDTPFKHGEAGHFRVFYNDIADAKNLSIRHVVGEQNGESINTFAVVDTTIPMTEDTIHRAVVATFDNREGAEGFIRNVIGKSELQSGLLGHTRVGYFKNNAMKLNESKREISIVKEKISSVDEILVEKRLRAERTIEVFNNIKSDIEEKYTKLFNSEKPQNMTTEESGIIRGAVRGNTILAEMGSKDGSTLYETVQYLFEKEAKKMGYGTFDFTPRVDITKQMNGKFEIQNAEYEIKNDITGYMEEQKVKLQAEYQKLQDKFTLLQDQANAEEDQFIKYIFELQADPLQGGGFEIKTPAIQYQKALDFVTKLQELKNDSHFDNSKIVMDSNGIFSTVSKKGPITIQFEKVGVNDSRITFEMGNFRSLDFKPYAQRTDEEKVKIDQWLSDSKDLIVAGLEDAKSKITQAEKDFFAVGKDFHNFSIKKEIQATAIDLIDQNKLTGVLRVPTPLTLAITEAHVEKIDTYGVTPDGFTSKGVDLAKDFVGRDVTEIPYNNELNENDIITIDGVPYEVTATDEDNELMYVSEPSYPTKPYEGDIEGDSDVGNIVKINGVDHKVVHVLGNEVKLIRVADLNEGYVSDYIDENLDSYEETIRYDIKSIEQKFGKIESYADIKSILASPEIPQMEDDTMEILQKIFENNYASADTVIDLDSAIQSWREKRMETEYEFYRNAEDFGFTQIFFEDRGSQDYYYGTTENSAIVETYTSDSGDFHADPSLEFTREELGLPPIGEVVAETKKEQTAFDKDGQYVFDEKNLYSDNARTVYNYYKKTVVPGFRKLRKDARLITDDRGLQWWETTVTTADAGDLVMFMADKTGMQDATELPKLSLSDLKPIELPELVSLTKELMGKAPELTGRFKTKAGSFNYAENVPALAIKLDRNLSPQQLAKTLAHELGHLVDFLPDNTMKRGNLLGRLALLNNFFKESFESIIPRNKELRDELKTLTAVWTPFDPNTAPRSYVQYRNSAVELYAEFVSVLFNNPQQAQELAPKFFELFFESLDKKPEVKQAYFELQDMLNKDREMLLGKNLTDIHNMFTTGEQRALEIEYNRQKIAQQKFDNYGYKLKFELVSTIEPFRMRVNELRKQGILVPESENPVYGLEERNYMGGRINAFLLENIQPIYAQLHNMGLTWETFGTKLFLDRIADGDRSSLANPEGITQERAKELLVKMEAELGVNDYSKMDSLANDFRKSMTSLLTESYELGLIPEDQYQNLLKNDKYSTFQTIDHIDEKVTAKIYGQVGTFKPIRNVGTASVMKMLATIRRNEYQKARMEAVEFLLKYEPEDIQEADKGFDGEGMFFKEPKESNKKLIEVRLDGKRKGYYVDKYIAQSIDNQKIENVNATLAMIKWTNSKIFRPVYVVFSPGFHLFNLLKDFGRFSLTTKDKFLPSALWKTMKLYGKAAKVAYMKTGVTYEDIKNKQNLSEKDQEALDILTYLYKEKVLSVGFDEYLLQKQTGEDGQYFDEKEIELIMRNHGILVPDSEKKTGILDVPKKVWQGIVDGISMMGEFIEALPKVAGYYYYADQDGKLTREQKSFIRRKMGSPDFLDGGYLKPIGNEMYLFANAIVQGIKSDIDLGTEPDTRAGYWWKTAQYTMIPHALMLMAMLGLFGDDIEKIMDGVSEYDRTNFIIIPLGIDENGKSIYIRYPQPEATRLLGSVFWKLAITASGENRNTSKAFNEIFSFFSGQLPGQAPAMKLTGTLSDMLSGRNPYDSFYGRNIVSDRAFEAGGKYKWEEYGGWVFDQLTGGIFGRLYNSSTERKSTTLEKSLKLPLISSIAGRFLKVSDQGLRAKYAEENRLGKKDVAIKSIKRDELVEKYVKDTLAKPALSDDELKQEITNMIVEEYGYNPISDKYKGTKNSQTKSDREEAYKLRDRFEAMYIRGGGVQNAFISSLDSAANNTSKANIIKSRKDEVSSSEFQKDLDYAYEIGAISKPVYEEYSNN